MPAEPARPRMPAEPARPPRKWSGCVCPQWRCRGWPPIGQFSPDAGRGSARRGSRPAAADHAAADARPAGRILARCRPWSARGTDLRDPGRPPRSQPGSTIATTGPRATGAGIWPSPRRCARPANRLRPAGRPGIWPSPRRCARPAIADRRAAPARPIADHRPRPPCQLAAPDGAAAARARRPPARAPGSVAGFRSHPSNRGACYRSRDSRSLAATGPRACAGEGWHGRGSRGSDRHGRAGGAWP